MLKVNDKIRIVFYYNYDITNYNIYNKNLSKYESYNILSNNKLKKIFRSNNYSLLINNYINNLFYEYKNNEYYKVPTIKLYIKNTDIKKIKINNDKNFKKIKVIIETKLINNNDIDKYLGSYMHYNINIIKKNDTIESYKKLIFYALKLYGKNNGILSRLYNEENGEIYLYNIHIEKII